MQTLLTIVYILICIALIVIVLLQKGKNAGMSGAIDGGSNETFYGKNKGRSRNAMLEKFTAIAAIAFIVLAIVLSLVINKMPKADVNAGENATVELTQAPGGVVPTETVVNDSEGSDENADAQNEADVEPEATEVAE